MSLKNTGAKSDEDRRTGKREPISGRLLLKQSPGLPLSVSLSSPLIRSWWPLFPDQEHGLCAGRKAALRAMVCITDRVHWSVSPFSFLSLRLPSFSA